jgi:hypothetical protein
LWPVQIPDSGSRSASCSVCKIGRRTFASVSPGCAPSHASTVFVVSMREPKPQSLITRSTVRAISSSSTGLSCRRMTVAEYQPNRPSPLSATDAAARASSRIASACSLMGALC